MTQLSISDPLFPFTSRCHLDNCTFKQIDVRQIVVSQERYIEAYRRIQIHGTSPLSITLIIKKQSSIKASLTVPFVRQYDRSSPMPASSLTVSNLINYYSHRRSFRRESLRARKDYEVRFRLLEKVDRIYRIAKSEVLVANGEIGDEPIDNLLQSATPFIPTGQPSISCILFLCIRQYSPWSSIDVSNVLFLRSRPSRFVLARRPHAAS